MNVITFLKHQNFPVACAGQLGKQLDGVTHGDIVTYMKKHSADDWDGILSDIIDHWLNNDLNPSWEKLARALSACGYKVIAAEILGDETLGKLSTLCILRRNSDISVTWYLRFQGFNYQSRGKRATPPTRKTFIAASSQIDKWSSRYVHKWKLNGFIGAE